MGRHSSLHILFAVLLVFFLLSVPLAFAGSKGSPPPPPPPCKQKTPGCYTNDDFKESSGTLTDDDFGYFLSENACIPGGCSCSAGGFINSLKQVDPDESSGACSCIVGSSFDSFGKCCGDDTTDCGVVRQGALCAVSANFRQSAWHQVDQREGDVVYVGCQNKEYLSDGQNWIPCESETVIRSIDNRDYICLGTGDSCVNQFWKPDRSEVRLGAVFTQTSNCLQTRSETGTRCVDGASAGTAQVVETSVSGTTTVHVLCDINENTGQEQNCRDIPESQVQNQCIITNGPGESFNRCRTETRTTTIGVCKSCTDPTSDAQCVAEDNSLCSGGTQTNILCPTGHSPVEIRRNGNTVTYSCEASCSDGQAPTTSNPTNFTDTNEGSWVECCASGSCQTSNSENQVGLGEAITGGSIVYYCASNNKFLTDLDATDATDPDLLIKQQTCEAADLTWTGTRCCSEADDIGNPGEYYNDVLGGCWDGDPVLSVGFPQVRDIERDIINFNGAFSGCYINGSELTDNDDFVDIVDQHTGEPLVENVERCTLDPQGTYFCSFNEQWELTSGSNRGFFREAPVGIEVNKAAECCAESQCWDGTQCVGDQSLDANSPNHFDSFRCIQGAWNQIAEQVALDGSRGFCPRSDMCLVNIQGNAADNSNTAGNPQCISDGQFMEDALCFNGTWSTRTRSLALELIDIASDDYTLFCDQGSAILDSSTLFAKIDDETAQWLQDHSNNVCVLQQGGSTIIAASYNEAIPASAFTAAFGESSCEVEETGDFEACSGTEKVWFNSRMNAVVFSDSTIALGDPNLLDFFVSTFQSPFTSTVSTFRSLFTEPSFSLTFDSLEGTTLFSRVYIRQTGVVAQGGKQIWGVIEGDSSQNIVLRYTNFDTDMCAFMNTFAEQNNLNAASGIECEKQGDTFFVLVQGNQITRLQPENIWLDLTSKLRVE